MENWNRGPRDESEVRDDTELHSENEQRGRRGKGVIYAIIAVVVIGAIIAGVLWAMNVFGGPQEEEVTAAVDGYFSAAAANDREAANNFIYMGADAGDLHADDFSGSFEADIFFAYRAIQVNHYFAGDEGAYVYGLVEYNERPSREFTGVLREQEDGNWGLLRLWLEEPSEESQAASMLVAQPSLPTPA
ncbi:MAG: hypothetical protein WD533_03905 [Dehalococcoidia bacterium]